REAGLLPVCGLGLPRAGSLALGDEVGVDADAVQAGVAVSAGDADPVHDQLGVERGADGQGQRLRVLLLLCVAVDLHRGEVRRRRAAQVVVRRVDGDLPGDVRTLLVLGNLAERADPVVDDGHHCRRAQGAVDRREHHPANPPLAGLRASFSTRSPRSFVTIWLTVSPCAGTTGRSQGYAGWCPDPYSRRFAVIRGLVLTPSAFT